MIEQYSPSPETGEEMIEIMEKKTPVVSGRGRDD